MTTLVHVSDLHFGRPAVSEQLDSLLKYIGRLKPDAVAVSGDLTQRCSIAEFRQARDYLEAIGRVAPYIVIPGNHDIRWLGAVLRNLGIVGFIGRRAHEHKYSRYRRYISEDLSPSLTIPGVVIAGLNTAHGITRGSLTRRLRDLGVIGHVRSDDLAHVRRTFEEAPPEAARVVMIHHNLMRGPISGRHGLANTDEALRAFASLGAELVLCGHDHQEAVHSVETSEAGLVISTAGTISSRRRPGHPSSFNLVRVREESLSITIYAWSEKAGDFSPAGEHLFPRRARKRP
ncbi:metallophosphoesterase family protein [Rubrobacter calidifluminis]|uniref:metallophosphoesterase family protein n=1 Tax=Rubrobacter calidifluminis TaxID=1392640 RepID=UPI002362753D|nr:metallophosphoesterase [Rubrobacter calidifluminis]